MQLKHGDIWRAIDRLAEQHGFSPSGLAKKAGLSSTVFNPSKRSLGARKRWPSTESIAYILRATNTGLEEFVALASPEGTGPRDLLPLIDTNQAQKEKTFDDEGQPAGKGWEELRFPALSDPKAFALEIVGKDFEPLYREGDKIILSPTAKPRRNDRVAARTLKGEIIIGTLSRESARNVELTAASASSPTTLALCEIKWMYRIVWASQ